MPPQLHPKIAPVHLSLGLHADRGQRFRLQMSPGLRQQRAKQAVSPSESVLPVAKHDPPHCYPPPTKFLLPARLREHREMLAIAR